MTKKRKLTKSGEPCRKCLTPVVRKPGGTHRKKGQKYYFKSYLYCPKCFTMYMVESEKVYITTTKEK